MCYILARFLCFEDFVEPETGDVFFFQFGFCYRMKIKMIRQRFHYLLLYSVRIGIFPLLKRQDIRVPNHAIA